VEAGLELATSLLLRLERSGGRDRRPRALVRRVAERLYLLEEAIGAIDGGVPPDAYLSVEGEGAGRPFAAELAGMYRQWAERRGMRLATLHELDDGRSFRLLALVSGFAAFPILRSETGVHVLELPEGEGTERVHARVVVAGRGHGPSLDAAELLEQAELAVRAGEQGAHRIVRRYRALPSPLVRDGVRGWRTGRLADVLAGDFDLFEPGA
jgi:ATP-dependent Clp protease ATP-binding subunit ClpC